MGVYTETSGVMLPPGLGEFLLSVRTSSISLHWEISFVMGTYLIFEVVIVVNPGLLLYVSAKLIWRIQNRRRLSGAKRLLKLYYGTDFLPRVTVPAQEMPIVENHQQGISV